MTQLPRAAVIGAGSSGIAAVKALRRRGIDVRLLREERSRRRQLGLREHERDVLGVPPLHINTSRERMEYADFPMPKSYPDFPHHTQIARVLRRLRRPLRLPRAASRSRPASSTPSAAPTASGSVTLDDGESAATTRSSSPTATTGIRAGRSRRSPARRFDGRQMHAHDYVERRPGSAGQARRRGRMGNSAMDIAVESSVVAEHTYLSARRGAHVDPQVPVRQAARSDRSRSPQHPVRGAPQLFRRMLKLAVGDMERYGLPKPDHRLGDAHPTISGRHPRSRIAHGAITPKPNIAALDRRPRALHRRHRGRGRHHRLLHRLQGHVPVLRRRASSRRPTTTCRCSSASSTPTSRTCSSSGCSSRSARSCRSPRRRASGSATTSLGRYALPPPRRVRADIEARAPARCSRATSPSKRHTMQVDFDDYLVDAAQGAQAGARAGARGRATGSPSRRAARPLTPLLAESGVTRRRAAGASATKAANRAAILAAAREVFAELGYDAASVRDIDPPHGPRVRHVLQLLPRQGGGLPRARRARSATRRAGACARAASTLAATREFVEDAYRAYFEFIVEDPATSAFLRRNAGTIRAFFGDRSSRRAPTSSPRTCARRWRAASCRRSTSTTARTRWSPSGSSWARRMLERDPPDVEGATRFATELFLGGMARVSAKPR